MFSTTEVCSTLCNTLILKIMSMFCYHPMQGPFVWMFVSPEHGWPILSSCPCLLLNLSCHIKCVWAPVCFWEPLKVFVSTELICSWKVLQPHLWVSFNGKICYYKFNYISDEPFSFSIPFLNIFIAHTFQTIDHSRFLECIIRIDSLVIWKWRGWAGGSGDTGLAMKTWRLVGVATNPLPEALGDRILQGQGS